ncbi:MAG: hypothetical protein IH840_16555 [Candidatus Heimdallarchaeota archaeon]|nr:hypothetical protein [Candidatus Heimdallarchaeota archaeon]
MGSETDHTVDSVHSTLSNTSVELAGLFWEVPRDQQLHRSMETEWCALEILIHLKQVAEVYQGRVRRIMQNESGQLVHLRDYDEHKLLSKVKIEEESVKSNIQLFMKARSDLLNRVSLIDKEEWMKKVADHEVLGEVSLLELLSPLAKRETEFLVRLKSLIDE